MVLGLLPILLGGCGGTGQGDPSDPFVGATNRGRAHLENKESAQAMTAFEEAIELDDGRAPAWRNLARAQLLGRIHDGALVSLGKAAELSPESAATEYLSGLVHNRETRFAEALPHLEAAVRLDPSTPALRFQLASVLRSLGRHEEATEQLRETVRLDPLHPTAHYWLSIYALQAGDREEHAARKRDFERSRELLGDDARTPEALESCVYTRAETFEPHRQADPPIPLRLELADLDTGGARPVASLGIDAEGRATLVGVDGSGTLYRLTLYRLGSDPSGPEGIRALEATLPANRLEGRAVVGDYFDPWESKEPFDPRYHAHLDLLWVHAEGLHLFLGREDGGFDDVTEAAGLADAPGGRAAVWVDYEADGDLDIVVATAEGLDLWQNDGAGGFVEVSELVGLNAEDAAPDSAVADLAVADLDGDVLLDLVAAGTAGSPVFDNQRNGLYARRGDPPGPWPAARRVVLDDLDADGRVDVALLTDDSLVVVPAQGDRITLAPTPNAPTPNATAEPSRLEHLALVDLDNDGWLDLLATSQSESEESGEAGSRVHYWRNGGTEWTDASAAVGLDTVELPAIHGLLALDQDGDGDTDLVLDTGDGARLLRNEGGNTNGQLKIRLVGTKTNNAGLGTQVEIRRDRFRTARRVASLPIELGLGPADGAALDAVRVLWTNGIVDNEVALDPEAEPASPEGVLEIIEKNVAAGSCPFLYAWDGEGFRFVTDTLGNSPLGLSLARGIPLDADPDELVEIGPAESFPPRDGRYVVQVTEEMREVLYLDSAWLVAVDHAPELEVHPTDKLMPAPFPPSELWALAELRAPTKVEASDGIERTELVTASDGRFAPPGPLLPPPLRGQTHPLVLELDFGLELDSDRPWVLALEGWLQYGDASTNIALSQGAAPVIPPRLEAETPRGFEPVDAVVGMPAGKTKTILVDLEGRLPEGTRRLRLATTMEIRWDRIALGVRRGAPVSGMGSTVEHRLDPILAQLSERGFSEIRSRAPGHPTTPDFANVSPTPPWTTALRGWVTREGNVLPLVTERDGRLALVAAGDGLELHFDAATLPPVAEGQVRTFFFGSVGWDKDGDANVIDGEKVEPLPYETVYERPDPAWQQEWNTRFVPWDRFAEGGD